MSNHDTHSIDLYLGDEDNKAPCSEACGDTALTDNTEVDFKISVRKVQTKVQARGVLAE